MIEALMTKTQRHAAKNSTPATAASQTHNDLDFVLATGKGGGTAGGGGGFTFATGAPQPGHAAAAVLICRPHSEQVINAMLEASVPLGYNRNLR
jgi:hypothetical protein